MNILALNKGYRAFVDAEDYDRIRGFTWHVVFKQTNLPYVRTSIGGRKNRQCLYLHHVVLGIHPGKHVDHKNGNGLDNQKENLRVATFSLNQANRKNINKNNTSGFRGVTFNSKEGCWIAQITVNRKNRRLGRFASPSEAARVYDSTALKEFGEYASLNFPL